MCKDQTAYILGRDGIYSINLNKERGAYNGYQIDDKGHAAKSTDGQKGMP